MFFIYRILTRKNKKNNIDWLFKGAKMTFVICFVELRTWQ